MLLRYFTLVSELDAYFVTLLMEMVIGGTDTVRGPPCTPLPCILLLWADKLRAYDLSAVHGPPP